MSGARHTPGPWRLAASGIDGHKVVAPDGRNICGMSNRISLSMAERHANARLVAAAPDLLAALRDLVPADFDRHPDDFMPVWHAARAAIAKAEGRS